jgi:hypothetical protein
VTTRASRINTLRPASDLKGRHQGPPPPATHQSLGKFLNKAADSVPDKLLLPRATLLPAQTHSNSSLVSTSKEQLCQNNRRARCSPVPTHHNPERFLNKSDDNEPDKLLSLKSIFLASTQQQKRCKDFAHPTLRSLCNPGEQLTRMSHRRGMKGSHP